MYLIRRHRRASALRLMMALTLLAWLSSSVATACFATPWPFANPVSGAAHCQDTDAASGGTSPPFSELCAKAPCFGIEATEEMAAVMHKASDGPLSFPAFMTGSIGFFGLLAFPRRLRRDLFPLQRPPPIPGVPLAYRYCILLM